MKTVMVSTPAGGRVPGRFGRGRYEGGRGWGRFAERCGRGRFAERCGGGRFAERCGGLRFAERCGGLQGRRERHDARRRSERGLSLLECIASLAIAALVLSSTTRISEASATLVRRARVTADTVDVARNLLERELGAPCGAPLACPAGYRCEVTRSPVTATADRVRASVAREDGAASEELLTVAPAPACGS